MLICTYKFSDEFVKLLCHPLESVYVAYRLPVGGEVHAAVSSLCGSPKVKAIRWCASVKVSGEVQYSESNLIAVGHFAGLILLLPESLKPRPILRGSQSRSPLLIASFLKLGLNCFQLFCCHCLSSLWVGSQSNTQCCIWDCGSRTTHKQQYLRGNAHTPAVAVQSGSVSFISLLSRGRGSQDRG